ncbi:MAG TPA: dienelactone hydrolase family protein [Luteitalea sp.]|nr:dienelactone hydrolase family protein [Luteitalea sp.]
MKTSVPAAIVVAALVTAAPAHAQVATSSRTSSSAAAPDPHAGHAMEAQAPAASSAKAKGAANLPPAEEDAKARLNASPRHGEYADVALPGGAKLRSWVSYPERKDKAPVVIVIHEIFGLSDWIRSVADQLAADGYIAIAPDLLTGKGPNGGGTEAYATRDDVVAGVRGLTPEEVVTKLDAVRAYATKLPAANGKTATVGYCWGGSTSFMYATKQAGLNAAVVYYGGSPSDASTLAAIKAPVLGLYGENDARVNATIEPAKAEMAKLKKVYEPHIYTGAGHGFLRAQAGQDGANLKATQEAWPTMLAFFAKHLK